MTMAGSKEGIAERRLRPLWDAIDSRQYKSALKIVSGLLTKYPTSPYLMALKGLILERTGKPEEALALCQQSKGSGPVDDLTLNTLQMVYQRLDKLDQITQCYEYATSKNPNNFELLSCLFNCYVREYTYVKQQHIAMKLYKLFGDEKYLLWAVCSIQLQVHCGDGNGVRLLPLAEAMLKKRIQSHGLTELESLLVYVSVLREQQKFDVALETLSGKLGSLFTIPAEKLLLQGELLMESKQYMRAAEVYKHILKLNPDDWEAFLHLLDAIFEKSRIFPTAKTSVAMSNPDAALLKPEECNLKLDEVDSFVDELAAKEVDYVKRGPFLAKLEIARMRLLSMKRFSHRDTEGVTATEHELTRDIVHYYKSFGHMVSFASDVKRFVEHVAESEKDRLSGDLHSMCSDMVDQDPTKLLRWRIAAYQVEELLTLKARWSNKKLLAQAICIAKLYVENLHLSINLDPQESMHGEELLVLVANLVIELFRRTQEIGYLIEAILVLEFGLAMRKYNSQYKLLLINLYSLLSAGQSALYWYKTLEIKYVLLDTLSHHMVYYLLGSSLWSDLEPLLKDSIKFHKDHEVEAADLAINAYRKGTHSKVLEFVQFKRKLQRSHHYSLVRIEDSILSLKKESTPTGLESSLAKLNSGCDAYRLSDKNELSELTFLEDVEMRPWWSPTPDECFLTGPARSSECMSRHQGHGGDRRTREERARLGLRKRGCLPRLLYLSLHALSSKQQDVQSDSINAPTDLGLLVEEYSSSLGVSWDNLDSWLGNMVEAKHFVDQTGVSVVDVLTFAVFSSAQKLQVFSSQVEVLENGLEESFETLLKAISTVLDLVLGSVTKSSAATAADAYSVIDVVAPGSGLSVLMSLTSEVFAWIVFCMQSWAKHMQPAGKKKKKAGVGLSGEELVDQKALTIMHVLQRLQVSLINDLERLSLWLTMYLERPEKNEVAHVLSLLKQDSLVDGLLVRETPAPGTAIQELQSSATVEMLSKWRPQSIVTNIVSSQRAAFDSIRDLVKRQLKSLKLLRL